jgi:hypothetical protein
MKFSLKPEDRKYKDTEIDSEILPIEKSKEVINDDFNPWDYVRVVNVRGEQEYQATSDEKVIVAHRGNPILGNKHPMLMPSMKERERVIAEYSNDLDNDLAAKGPMFNLLQNIAQDIVENKQKIAFSCYCLPCDCHAQKLVPVIIEMVKEILINKLNYINNKKIKI